MSWHIPVAKVVAALIKLQTKQVFLPHGSIFSSSVNLALTKLSLKLLSFP